MIVYIDGENAIHQLVDALRRMRRIDARDQMLDFNLSEMVYRLIGRRDVSIKYYTTSLKVLDTTPELEQKSREMVLWIRHWSNNLTKQKIEVIKAGKLKARSGIICRNCGNQDAIFREKGVDVRIAVDLIVDSVDQKTVFIWSSDADLLPAIHILKERGVRVKNLAHTNSLNLALARQCGEWQTFTDQQLVAVYDNEMVTTNG